MSKEIVCLNIGQAGVQISNSCWELFCIEHGLDSCGNLRVDDHGYDDELFRSNFATFFNVTKSGKCVPRSISIDLEPSVIDEIRLGPYRKLWNPDYLISGLEDASNNYGRGFISVGKTMIDNFLTNLSKLVQECDKLHGMILLHSYSGGTGSGFTSLILDSITDEYSKVTNISSCIFPSPEQSTSVVEPYNCVLAASASLYNIDVALLSDNQSLFDICSKKLMIQQPNYYDINRLISQLYSSLTVTLRFGSSLDHDIVQLQTNLIPFPRLHFPISTFAPIGDHSKTDHEGITTCEMTHQLFDEDSRFISCNNSDGKFMACCLFYRGLVKPKEVNVALQEIKNRKDIAFVDWSPVGFKIGISPMPPAAVAQSSLAPTNKNCSMFYNSTAIEKIWNVIHKKFFALYKKKAFLHWFIGEGMEELEFLSAMEEISNLQKDYKQIGDQTDDWYEDRFKHGFQQDCRKIVEGSDDLEVSTSDDNYQNEDDICKGQRDFDDHEDHTDLSQSIKGPIPKISSKIKSINVKVEVTKHKHPSAKKPKIHNNSNLLYEDINSENSNNNYSVPQNNRSLYTIAKVNLKARFNMPDNEVFKNRQLLKLFQECCN